MDTCNADGGQALLLRSRRILPHERLAVQKYILHSGPQASLHQQAHSPEQAASGKILCRHTRVTADRQFAAWLLLYVKASSTLKHLATCTGSVLSH